jgi:hypothetical protein
MAHAETCHQQFAHGSIHSERLTESFNRCHGSTNGDLMRVRGAQMIGGHGQSGSSSKNKN